MAELSSLNMDLLKILPSPDSAYRQPWQVIIDLVNGGVHSELNQLKNLPQGSERQDSIGSQIAKYVPLLE